MKSSGIEGRKTRTKKKLDIVQSRIISRKPDATHGRYRAVYYLTKAVGVLYITNASPQYLSGHVRLLGRSGGRYPHRYKEMVDELFGSSTSLNMIECCSGDVKSKPNLYTVDINKDKDPSLVCDAQALPAKLYNRFDRWGCDPPYNHNTATKMYDTKLPSFSRLLTEGARVVKPGGLLFFLIGNKNIQWCPPSLTRIGLLFCTIVPLQEDRALHIYFKLR